MKTKILTVFLITLAVVGLSWIYLNRLSASVSKNSVNEIFLLTENKETITPTVNTTNTNSNKHSNRSLKNVNRSQSILPTLSNNLKSVSSTFTNNRINSSLTTSSNGSSSIFGKRNKQAAYSTGSSQNGLMALASGSRSVATSSNLPPFTTMRQAPKPPPPLVLVDPGSSDPDPEDQIPVGNGTLLLLLMSGLYGAYRMRK